MAADSDAEVSASARWYRVVSSLDIVPLDDNAVLLRADTGSCRLEGRSAELLAEKVLPALRRWTELDALAAVLPGYALSDLADLLDSLVEARLVTRASTRPDPVGETGPLLGDLGFDEPSVGERLRNARVTVLGQGHTSECVRNALERAGLRLTAPATDTDAQLQRADVFALAERLELMLVCFDRSFLAARHWANQACLASGCAAIFVDVRAVEAIVGPTVLPGETGCYTCFRMRHLATLDNFKEAMAHERYLDQRKDGQFARPSFPGLAEIAAGAIVNEAMRLLLGPMVPALANAVLRIDAVSGGFERHEVLRHPECPHCRGIDTAVRTGA